MHLNMCALFTNVNMKKKIENFVIAAFVHNFNEEINLTINLILTKFNVVVLVLLLNTFAGEIGKII